MSSHPKPTPPGTIPQYIVDGLDRQDQDTLKDIIAYARECIKHLKTEAAEADTIQPDDGEQIEDVEEQTNYTKVVKKVPCGKSCSGCPHGPYVYHVRRVGNKLEWDYQGPVSE